MAGRVMGSRKDGKNLAGGRRKLLENGCSHFLDGHDGVPEANMPQNRLNCVLSVCTDFSLHHTSLFFYFFIFRHKISDRAVWRPP